MKEANWSQMVRALWEDVSEDLAVYILVALLFVGMLAGRRKLIVRLRVVDQEAGKPWCTDFGHTAEALLLALLICSRRRIS